MDVVTNDRELLQHLSLGDFEVAGLLGVSRQTLNNQLGSYRAIAKAQKKQALGLRYSSNVPLVPDNYFKMHEVYFLVQAAQKWGHSFNMDAVLEYLKRTRSNGKDKAAYDLLMPLLANETGIGESELKQAGALVLLVPDGVNHTIKAGQVKDVFKKVIDAARKADAEMNIIVLAETPMKARIAATALGTKQDLCFGHEKADLHLPSAFVYSVGKEYPAQYSLTETGFIRVSGSRDVMQAFIVQWMLPESVKGLLRPTKPAPPQFRSKTNQAAAPI